MTPALSVVIPIRDEAENIAPLWRSLRAALPAGAEVVFVDDGSRDATWELLASLARGSEDALARRSEDPSGSDAPSPTVRAIRFRRNFGQTAAMACGIRCARAPVIVTMDGDLQNDPVDIPRLVATLQDGYDVVCGWRRDRRDPLWSRKVPSWAANRLIGWLTGVRLHDYGCSLKAYRAEVVRRLPLYGEWHRFIPALAVMAGASITETPVRHHARRFGRTKYSLARTWRVAFDMITVAVLVKFLDTPLRFFGLASVVAVGAGWVFLTRAWHWYVGPSAGIPQVLPAAGLLSLWLAGHLGLIGLLAELALASAAWRPRRVYVGASG